MRAKVGSEADVSDEEESSDETCECGCERRVDHGDEVVCPECGLVLEEDRIDPGPEWRSFSHEEKQSKCRVGAPTTATMHDRGLTTVMGDISTTGMSREKRERLDRQREWDTRSKQTPKERGLKFSLGEIQRMASALELGQSVQEDAAIVFREAHEEDLVKGRSYEGMSSAAIYIACRQQEIPRTFGEVAEISRVEEQRIVRSYKKISSELGLELPPADPSDLIPRFVSEIQKEFRGSVDWNYLEGLTRTIVEETKDAGLHSGRSPVTVVAGAIYLAAGKMDVGMTQSDVATPISGTQVSIRSMYHDQAELLDIDVDSISRTSPGRRTYDIPGLGEVEGARHRDFAHRLLECHDPSEVSLGERFDFVLYDKYAIDLLDDPVDRKFTDKTWVVVGPEETSDVPCDQWCPRDQSDRLVPRLR